MTQLGRIMVVAGLVLAVVGLAVWGLGRMGFRGLPGDIRYDSDRVKIYFPVVSCLVLSALLTGLIWLVGFIREWWHR